MAELTKPIESFISLLLDVSGRARPIDLEAHVPVGAEEVLRAYAEAHPEMHLDFDGETLVLKPPAAAPEPEAPSPWLVPETEPTPPAAGPFTPEPAPQAPEVDLSAIPLVDTTPAGEAPPFVPVQPSSEAPVPPEPARPAASEPAFPGAPEPARTTTDDSEFFEFSPAVTGEPDAAPSAPAVEQGVAPVGSVPNTVPVMAVPPLPEIPAPAPAEPTGAEPELIFVQQSSDEDVAEAPDEPRSFPLPDLSSLPEIPEIPEVPPAPGALSPETMPQLSEDEDDIGL